MAFAQIVHALFIGGMAFRPFGGVGKGLFLLGGGGLYLLITWLRRAGQRRTAG